MANIRSNQGNCVVPRVPGRIMDWGLESVAFVTLLGNPNRSYIKDAPGNSLHPDEIISEGVYIYGGNQDLDRGEFFYPVTSNPNAITDENGHAITDNLGNEITF